MSVVDMLRDRLLAVDWQFGIDETREETKARIALFREFMRRSAPLAAGSGAQPAPWPFFDVAATIDAEVRAPEQAVAEVVAKVPRYPATAVRRTAVYALHYAALVDGGKAPDPSRDPFAPLVYMYELGGSFAPDHVGGIQIGVASFGVGQAADWLGQPAPAGLPAFPDLAGIRPG
ncbi:hypothetical protein KDL01_01015 [Actinospica durhamensis]|uniref:Uncharacterized protein n=1 Tax=Actinospica durhamensis TaxID=1508375 RepID=A0A941EJ81_9ACTN|nr:hypothetical protein [Actinospica durhamensis]MBR7831818.1 hypothetical protein [Actinospica durhamensis]